MSDINENSNYKNFVENIIPNLKFGDIIYAKRYNTLEEKVKIKSGHENGPYIVIKIDNDKLICAYCSSKIQYNSFVLTGKGKTFVQPSSLRVIDSASYISLIYSRLNHSDKLRLMKRLTLNNNNQHTYDDHSIKKSIKINFEVDYEVFDIVKIFEKKFIIIEKVNEKFILLPIKSYSSVYAGIKKSIIDYDNPVEIMYENLKYFIYLNTISEKQQLNVLKTFKKKIEQDISIQENIKSFDDYPTYNSGTMVCLRNDSNKKYIICDSDGENYSLLDFNEILNGGEFNIYSFPKYIFKRTHHKKISDLIYLKGRIKELNDKSIKTMLYKFTNIHT